MPNSKRHLRRRRTIAAKRSKDKNQYVRTYFEEPVTKPDPLDLNVKMIVEIDKGWKYHLTGSR